jgi:hypothetical protein
MNVRELYDYLGAFLLTGADKARVQFCVDPFLSDLHEVSPHSFDLVNGTLTLTARWSGEDATNADEKEDGDRLYMGGSEDESVSRDEAKGFFSKLGVDIDTDLIAKLDDWRDFSRDELVEKFAEILDEMIESEKGGEKDSLADLDAEIEDLLQRSQALRERAEDMIQRKAAAEKVEPKPEPTYDFTVYSDVLGDCFTVTLPLCITPDDYVKLLNDLWRKS